MICFHYWYLWYSEQQYYVYRHQRCCDLLSIIGIFGILNNFAERRNTGRRLWFAFNYWYLWYSEQHDWRLVFEEDRCDLLSIIGIFGILNNNVRDEIKTTKVVICFQLLVSLVFWTTFANFACSLTLLWFAFNYWYLWYSEQHEH